ncbi:NeuD/PglB/VioB family sugar acetyltransferase [Acidobacteria bacterium AH-259-L09]|nr:NeuD/PglB/VioB family sugar acetyltransferase [Acidobacteria bacterium AH-259-L09]
MIDHSKTPVIVIGVGGHGRVIRDILRSAQRPVIGFLDDNVALQGSEISGVPVLGGIRDAQRVVRQEGAEVAVGVGDNLIRGRLLRLLQSWGVPVTYAVHPKAYVAEDVVIGAGVVVMAGAVVSRGSSLRFGSVVNTKVSIDQKCHIQELAHVLPGSVLTDGVVVERYAFVGSGAVILSKRRIGENAYIGAGAVVSEDIPASTVAVGIPARVIKYRYPLSDL